MYDAMLDYRVGQIHTLLRVGAGASIKLTNRNIFQKHGKEDACKRIRRSHATCPVSSALKLILIHCTTEIPISTHIKDDACYNSVLLGRPQKQK